MEAKKSFWKKYEAVIAVAIVLLLVYALAVFNQKINFFLGNELIVSLQPAQKSFNMYYGNKTDVEFDVSVYNSAQCRTACEYEFSDRSRNDALEKGNFELDSGQHFKKTYELSVKRLGRGQDIYSFDTRCRSMRTLLCLTSQPVTARSSFITVNYDLTEEEKKLKETLRKNITELLFALSDSDIGLQKLNQKYFELAHRININNLSKEKIEINGIYDDLAISIENLRSIWAVEKYEKLSRLFNESFFMKIESIKKSTEYLNGKIDGIAEVHNSILQDLEGLSNSLNEIEMLANMLQSEEFVYDVYVNSGILSAAYSDVINNTFENYTELMSGISAMKDQQAELAEKLRLPSAEIFFKTGYTNEFNDYLLCSLRQDCGENISISKVVYDTAKFLDDYPDTSSIKSGCYKILGLDAEYSKIRSEYTSLIADRSISFPAEESFMGTTQIFKDNIIRKINNSYYSSSEKIKLNNGTNKEIIKIANSTLPKSSANIPELSYNQSLNMSLYWLSKINLSANDYEAAEKCSRLNLEPKTGILKLERISTNITYKVAPKISTELSDNPPICCVFNECNPCCADDSCRSDPKTFPVILLHGHSLAKSNSPEYSLDSLNKLQSKLQEDGYLNVGIVSLYSKNDPVESGVWSLSGKPVAVKASYYYDAFRKEDEYIVVPTKSENIDTYAIRLKELVEIVKSRTNKPKVNIVAHSMGGLVARRYIQIFGDSDVDKLVMIAAPNKGIKDTAASYCGIIGENRECMDMLADSLFINKLNDFSGQPKNVRLYSIIGDGCKMKGGQGDGVILKESAELENAELHYVNGSCDGLATLHTDILDVDRYPEVYNTVKEILKE
ncbi:alpha/beta hydrolase [Candidatus Woesearchaeota archaeon]|nr:alpha/beta hydrolase [Candidatus Woesearchaeota archaeon]